jgi:AmiR/NasT family two-component response regulator
MGENGHHHTAIDELRSEIDGLRDALVHRDVIGQAKGMLMERHDISAEEAFGRLVRISQDTNVKLHAVAAMVVGGSSDGDGAAAGDGQRPEQTWSR